MGLDATHGAFHGAYSAFNRFRQKVVSTVGGSYPPHSIIVNGETMMDPELDQTKWYWDDDYDKETHPGLYAFLMHSDCDGEFTPEECTQVADDLEALLPSIDENDLGSGHIERDGGFKVVTERFIAGCRAAAAAGESLGFH